MMSELLISMVSYVLYCTYEGLRPKACVKNVVKLI